MPHPLDKRERFLLGKWKGEKRTKEETAGWFWPRMTEEEIKENLRVWSYRRRNTTKICGGSCCKNPRRNGWEGKRGQLTMQEIRHGLLKKLDPFED